MPAEIRLTPAAERDLIDIWVYTADEWGVDQADHYLAEIERALDRLRDYPERGADIREVRAGYRRLPVGRHRIYYRLSHGVVEIIRVLHARMDVSSRLGE